MLSDPNLIAEFVVESLEHLEAIEPLLLELEKRGSTDASALNEIFRAIHSIKGAAGFLGLENICSLSHAAESLLMRLRDGLCEFHVGMAEPLLRAVDALRALLRGLPVSQGEPASDLIAKLEALLAPCEPPGETSAPDPFGRRRRRPGVARNTLRSCRGSRGDGESGSGGARGPG